MSRTKLTPAQIASGAQRGYVAANEATTSTATYVDLTTVGPSVTVTIGVSGMAIMIFGAEASNSTTGYADIGVVISGANTEAVGTAPHRYFTQGTSDNKGSYVTLLTGLSVGSTTFKLQYRAITGGTATFQYRELIVIPIG